MRVFNRIVVTLLLAGLFALGVFAVFYSFDLLDYSLAELPTILGLSGVYDRVSLYVENIEDSRLIPVDFAILPLIAILGLILLILELKPRRPRRVRMQSGTYVTRSAIEDAVVEATERDPELLKSNVSVKARRKPGAKVAVRASVRQGEDVRSLQSAMQDRIQRHLEQVGLPAGNVKVRVAESDPRETKTRVR